MSKIRFGQRRDLRAGASSVALCLSSHVPPMRIVSLDRWTWTKRDHISGALPQELLPQDEVPSQASMMKVSFDPHDRGSAEGLFPSLLRSGPFGYGLAESRKVCG